MVFLVAVAALFAYVYDNLVANLRRAGIRTDFGFLDQPAGFEIAGSPFESTERVRNALVVGLRNTASLSLFGVVLTTVVGVVVGVARLSGNWLVRRAAGLYVESLRNIPPLLVIVFVFTAVILPLPTIQQATDLGVAVLSNRDLAVAGPLWREGSGAYLGVLVLGAVLAGAVAVWRTRREDASGVPHHRVLWAAGLLSAVAVVGWLALGRPVGLSRPEIVGLGVEGGIVLKGAYVAMLAALVLYTASHVAEIVRGSIQAVPRGQTEAAIAVNLSGLQRFRHVVFPQAFVTMLPPYGNLLIEMMKASALVSLIDLQDLLNRAQNLRTLGAADSVSIFVVVLLLYFCLSGLITLGIRALERHFGRPFAPAVSAGRGRGV